MVRLDASRSGVSLRNRITSSAKRKATVQVKAALSSNNANEIGTLIVLLNIGGRYERVPKSEEKISAAGVPVY